MGPGDPSTGISVPRGGPGAQPSDALFRASGQAPLRVRTPGIHGWPAEPCAVRRWRHMAIPSRGVKTGKCGPRTPLGAPTLSWTQAVTQASPRAEKTFGSPYLPRKPHRSSPTGVGRSRAGDGDPGAPFNEPSKHRLGRAGQALEPGAGYREWETNAPNGDPGAWPPSHRNTGAKTLSLLAPRPCG